MKSIFIGLTLAVLSPIAIAKDTSSAPGMEIDNIYLFSKEENIFPTHKGLTQLRFTSSIVWSNDGSCDTAAVVIRNEDTHMISAVLAAKASSTPIRLFADDQFKEREQCYLRAVGY